MKYRIGSLLLEDVDTYVRISVIDGFDGTVLKTRVTKRERPTAIEVAELVCELRELRLGLLDRAHLQACGRAATAARENWDAKQLILD